MSVLKVKNASNQWVEVLTIAGAGPKTGTVTLSTTWSGNGPYTQTVTVTGVSITNYSKVDIQPDATAIQQMIDDEVAAIYISNTNGTLTAYAVGAAPTVAMTLQVTVMEVSS